MIPLHDDNPITIRPIVTIGLISMAQLMAVSTIAHSDARETSLATELGQAKLDELMKADLDSDPRVQVTPVGPDSLEQNVNNYFDNPDTEITRRWKVDNGPTADTRIITVRVINPRARQAGSEMDFTTIIREW